MHFGYLAEEASPYLPLWLSVYPWVWLHSHAFLDEPSLYFLAKNSSFHGQSNNHPIFYPGILSGDYPYGSHKADFFGVPACC